jgi:hypothetical protein
MRHDSYGISQRQDEPFIAMDFHNYPIEPARATS